MFLNAYIQRAGWILTDTVDEVAVLQSYFIQLPGKAWGYRYECAGFGCRTRFRVSEKTGSK